MLFAHSPLAITLFCFFVCAIVGFSFHLGRRTTSSAGYYAAGGQVHWFTNGIAFAGDYLSAASFLGICGMIATVGYDGWVYGIGYLAGWMVALFLLAEPMKRLGKFTFTDALDARFNSKGIQLMAAISTLIVSVFYLIPQMVGAGTLLTPLFGLPHAAGVAMVGIVVTIIVATAGMASTTVVQFVKGAMLLIFSTILVIAVLLRGLSTPPDHGDNTYHRFQTLAANIDEDGRLQPADPSYVAPADWRGSPLGEAGFVLLTRKGVESIWQVHAATDKNIRLEETLYTTQLANGARLFNGARIEEKKFFPVGHLQEIRLNGEPVTKTGALAPLDFLTTLQKSTVVLWETKIVHMDDAVLTIHTPKPTPGSQVLRPGQKFKVEGSATEKFNFISLMLALFCGTAALPHILIRYNTVPSQAAARKSTLVAIAAIGLFYILTLFLGLGAMTSGVVNLWDDNMSAPLLARSFGVFLFAIITSIAFVTVLGTVSGLIVAASGAVAHDLMDNFLGMRMSDREKVIAGKIAAIIVGFAAIYLGIAFEGMNVSFLVGWAFALAASANLPALLMLLFWPKTTAQGVTASILVGLTAAMGLILISPDMYVRYGLLPSQAPIAFNSPAAISIPLSFLALIVVSLLTQKKERPEERVRANPA